MAKKVAPVVAPPGPRPLLVVAGLPRSTANTIKGTIENRREVNVVAAAFGDAGPAAYTDAAIRTLLERACSFALVDRQGRPVEPIPSPNRLLLAYVKQPGFERLIDAFGVSAIPLPMHVEGWKYPGGREWRESIEDVTREVLAAFDTSGAPPRQALRSRLEARSSAERLLLPSRNFNIAQGVLYDAMRERLTGAASWDDFGQHIEVRRFPFDTLPTYYAKTGGENARFAVDARGLVFANALVGRHGPTRAMPEDPKPSAAALRALLESMFRLGSPLLDGFQHDVQWPEDAPLKNELFQCPVEGDVEVSATHANVYPNDAVRPG